MKKLDFIQALRGIAAMLVVLYHCRATLNTSYYNFGSLLFDSGSIGVDLFFMISGFIMIYTTYQKESSPKAAFHFLINRIIRIVPLYWICTFLFMLITAGATWFSVAHNWTWLAKGLFFIPMDLNAMPPFLGYAPLFTGWTLNYEMLFYIIFGISILFSRFRWYFFFGVFAVTLFIIPLLNHNFALDPFAAKSFSYPILNFLCNPIMLDFVFGVCAGLLYFSSFSIKNKNILFLLPILSISFFLWQYFSGVNGGHGIAKWGLSCGALFLSFILFFKERTFAIPKWMVFLGDISYSLYITHIVVLVLLEKIMTGMGLEKFIENPLFFIPMMGCIISFSYITWYLIENKLSKALKRFAFRK